MVDIIEFPRDPLPERDDGSSADDMFLRDEGLALLASFRTIKDAGVRASIMSLIESLSRLDLPDSSE